MQSLPFKLLSMEIDPRLKIWGWRNLAGKVERCGEFIWWRYLRKVCGRRSSNWFDNMVGWKLGEGGPTSFWFDKWCGEDCLVTSLIRVFQKDEMICNMGT